MLRAFALKANLSNPSKYPHYVFSTTLTFKSTFLSLAPPAYPLNIKDLDRNKEKRDSN